MTHDPEKLNESRDIAELDGEVRALQLQLWTSYEGVRLPDPITPLPDFWKGRLAECRKDGKWWYHRDSKSQLKAHIGYSQFQDDFFCQLMENCLYHFDWQDQSALEWMKQSIASHLPAANARSHVLLPAVYCQLWPAFKTKGFGISEICFGGFPKLALHELQLHGKKLKKEQLKSLGLTLQALKDPQDIPMISQLRQKVFSDEPERCWFYLNPGVAEVFDRMTLDRLNSGRQWIFKRGQDILGFFGYGLQANGYHGRRADIDFAVDQSLHGQGLGRWAYQIMLEKMLKDEVDYFSGSTTNPAVIHLAGIMQRPFLHFELRRLELCPDQGIFSKQMEILGIKASS